MQRAQHAPNLHHDDPGMQKTPGNPEVLDGSDEGFEPNAASSVLASSRSDYPAVHSRPHGTGLTNARFRPADS